MPSRTATRSASRRRKRVPPRRDEVVSWSPCSTTPFSQRRRRPRALSGRPWSALRHRGSRRGRPSPPRGSAAAPARPRSGASSPCRATSLRCLWRAARRTARRPRPPRRSACTPWGDDDTLLLLAQPLNKNIKPCFLHPHASSPVLAAPHYRRRRAICYRCNSSIVASPEGQKPRRPVKLASLQMSALLGSRLGSRIVHTTSTLLSAVQNCPHARNARRLALWSSTHGS
jgi:hypothetical protein